ncbi:MAG: hypothetical protein SFY92_10650 [Verrucomicrobiae bacterium]|nr:hypothetical protein [Verrucomicrobiae bacterium]
MNFHRFFPALLLLPLMIGGSPLPLRAAAPEKAAVSTGKISPGDSEDKVRKLMGAPRGSITLASGEKVLSYDTGEITLRAGKVILIEILPGGVGWESLRKKNDAAVGKVEKNSGRDALKKLVLSREYATAKPLDKLDDLSRLVRFFPDLDVSKELAQVNREIEEFRKLQAQAQIELEKQRTLDREIELERERNTPTWWYIPGGTNGGSFFMFAPPGQRNNEWVPNEVEFSKGGY